MSQVLVLPASQQFFNLVGGIPTPLKNHGVKVSWDSSSQSMQSHNPAMFQSPPTRVYTIIPYNYGKSPFLKRKITIFNGFSMFQSPPTNEISMSRLSGDPMIPMIPIPASAMKYTGTPAPAANHRLREMETSFTPSWRGNWQWYPGAQGVSSKPWGNYKG